MTASVTTGTLSNPLFHDDNGGKQFAGRVEWRPTPGLNLGASAAHGEFVSTAAANAALAVARQETMSGFVQNAWGVDAEYSRDYFLIRSEVIGSAWRVPFAERAGAPRSAGLHVRVRRRPVQDQARTVCRGPVRSPRIRDDHGGDDVGTVGCAGDANRSGGRIFAVPESPAQRLRISTTRGTAVGSTPSANLVATQVVFWF